MPDKLTGTLPHNLEAEKCLLGTILCNPECMNDIQEVLKSDAYLYLTQHKLIYNSILDLYKNNIPIDALTLGENLNNHNNLDSSGGMGYISEVIDSGASSKNAVYYANIIKDKYILRSLISKTNNILKQCYEPAGDIKNLVYEAEKSIFEISDETVSEGFQHVNKFLSDILEQIENLSKNKEQVPGVSTGYTKMDELTNGFQRSDMIILAGRPSMGKTSLAMNLAYNAVKNKVPVAVFSLEMSSEQIVQRLVSLAAKVPMEKIRTGRLEDTDWMRIVTATDFLNEAPMYIDNTYGIDPVTMMSKIRRLKNEVDVGLIVIDYLQMMKLKGSKIESRQQEVSEISRGLKGIAREFNIPVIVLSQLSRQLESRQDKRPQLSDLRESGAIEQDADLVMFVYRDEKYNPDTEKKGIAEVIVSKHRNGPLGIINLTFLEKYMAFENCAYEFEDEYE